ncbi:MAG: recombinase XerD [Methylophaga sp.]|nr:MAG: recombinase XerD [Methylophaga sp.]
MDLTGLIEDWLSWLLMNKGRSPATIIKYRGYLNIFKEHLGDSQIVDVDLDLLEDFSGKVLFDKGLASRSRSAAVSSIKNFFSWLKLKNIISSDPSDKLAHPSIGRRLPKAITLQDAEKLIGATDLDTFIGVRDAAMMSLLIGCGLRVSGLCNLNQSNLMFTQDNEGRERLVIRAIEKGNKERLVPAPTECLLLIRAYIGHRELDVIDTSLPSGDKVLFVSVRNRTIPEHEYHGERRRFAPRSVNDMLAKYAKETGVSVAFAHPHALRHLYGAELMESDVNILSAQALLGHESADTTAIYSHLAMRKLTKDVDRANPLGKMHTPVTDLIPHLNG